MNDDEVRKREMDADVPTGFPIDPDLLKWQMSPEEDLNRLYHEFSGKLMMKTDSGYKQIELGEPMMNDEGIRVIIGYLSTFLSKDKILTDLSEEQINMLMRKGMRSIIYNIMMNYKRYEIKKTDVGILVAKIEATMLASLNRAIGGRTLDHQKPMIKRIERIEPGDKKHGFFSFIPGFGK